MKKTGYNKTQHTDSRHYPNLVCWLFFLLWFVFFVYMWTKSLTLIQIVKQSFPKMLFQNNIHLYPLFAFNLLQYELKIRIILTLCASLHHAKRCRVCLTSFDEDSSMSWNVFAFHSSTCFPVFLFTIKACEILDSPLHITNIAKC